MITLADVRAAVNLPDFDYLEAARSIFPEGRPVAPPAGVSERCAGVLVLIFPRPDSLHVLLTRRTDTLRGHSGQVSFPGGQRDPDDESFKATALRETCEELGLCETPQIIGTLTEVYIPPSNFRVYPTVATLPALPKLAPNPAEVAAVLTFSLHDLMNPHFRHEEVWNLGGSNRRIRYYAVAGHKVWGATAVMLSELEHRLRAVLGAERLAALL